jgi:hypothetical protein
MARNLQPPVLDLISEADLPSHLALKISIFKSIVAEAVGNLDAAVACQQNLIERICKLGATNPLALSEAFVRIGRLYEQSGDPNAAVESAVKASRNASDVMKHRTEANHENILVESGTITQIGDLLQVCFLNSLIQCNFSPSDLHFFKQDLGKGGSAREIYSSALSMIDGKKDGASLYQKALILDSKSFQDYRRGRLPEAIAGFTESLNIKLRLSKFESIREMQLAISHLQRWRSKEVISSKLSLAEKASGKIFAPKKTIFKSFLRRHADDACVHDAEA